MDTFKVKHVKTTVILFGFKNGELQPINNPVIQKMSGALYIGNV